MPISILVLEICMPIEYHERTLSFQIPHKVTYPYIGWYTYQHMDVIDARLCLYDFHTFLLA